MNKCPPWKRRAFLRSREIFSVSGLVKANDLLVLLFCVFPRWTCTAIVALDIYDDKICLLDHPSVSLRDSGFWVRTIYAIRNDDAVIKETHVLVCNSFFIRRVNWSSNCRQSSICLCPNSDTINGTIIVASITISVEFSELTPIVYNFRKRISIVCGKNF